MHNLKVGTATQAKMDNVLSLGVLDNAPGGATHYDVFWCQFLKKSGEILRFFEDGMWKVSNHKDGVTMLNNGECLDLWTKKIAQG